MKVKEAELNALWKYMVKMPQNIKIKKYWACSYTLM